MNHLYLCFLQRPACILYLSIYCVVSIKESDRGEGKGRRCCLVNVLECTKDDLKISFWKKILVVWCGVNCTTIHFSQASIVPSVRSSIHPLLQRSLPSLLCFLYSLNSESPGVQKALRCPATASTWPRMGQSVTRRSGGPRGSVFRASVNRCEQP